MGWGGVSSAFLREWGAEHPSCLALGWGHGRQQSSCCGWGKVCRDAAATSSYGEHPVVLVTVGAAGSRSSAPPVLERSSPSSLRAGSHLGQGVTRRLERARWQGSGGRRVMLRARPRAGARPGGTGHLQDREVQARLLRAPGPGQSPWATAQAARPASHPTSLAASHPASLAGQRSPATSDVFGNLEVSQACSPFGCGSKYLAGSSERDPESGGFGIAFCRAAAAAMSCIYRDGLRSTLQ